MTSFALGLTAMALGAWGFRADFGHGSWALLRQLFSVSLACSGAIAVLAGLSAFRGKTGGSGPS